MVFKKGKGEEMKEMEAYCPICGNREFEAVQEITVKTVIDSHRRVKGIVPKSIAIGMDFGTRPHAPYTCTKCRTEFGQLPLVSYVQTPRGLVLSVTDINAVRKLKSIGYGYAFSEDHYVVIGDGTHAVAILKGIYENVFEKESGPVSRKEA